MEQKSDDNKVFLDHPFEIFVDGPFQVTSTEQNMQYSLELELESHHLLLSCSQLCTDT